MAEKIVARKVPKDCEKGLALLYLQSQEPKQMPLKSFVHQYIRIYNEICKIMDELSNSGRH